MPQRPANGGLLRIGHRSAFSDAAAKTIMTTCLEKTSVKQVITNTTYGTDVRRWPIETPASFWTGIGLVILGLLLGPAFSWIRTS
jgi:hypothetical protein